MKLISNNFQPQQQQSERVDSTNCNLCIEATQHHCRLCTKSICVIFCSVRDPSSDNENHRIHKANDPRCKKVTPNSHSSPVMNLEQNGSCKDTGNSNIIEVPDEASSDDSVDLDCIRCKILRQDDPLCICCGA